MKSFWLCFVPLFVAVDAIGLFPIFLGLTEGMGGKEIRRTIRQSVITAALVALGFLGGGSALMRLLGITVADFMVAGGVLLFGISLGDLLTTKKRLRKPDGESLGAVPLGVPLIAGPAVLTTTLLLSNEYGAFPTALALVSNICLAGAVFWFAPAINRLLGQTGARTASKISSLLLAAIAVMIVRKGIIAFLAAGLGQGSG